MSKVKQEAKIDFYVTHIINEAAPSKGYAKVGFITATNESIKEKKYFLGFGTHRSFNDEFFDAKIEAKSITKLPAPHPITKEKAVWIDQAYNIFLGNKTNPFNDDLKLIFNPSYVVNQVAGMLKDVRPTVTIERMAVTIDIIDLYNRTFSKESLNVIKSADFTTIIKNVPTTANSVLGTSNNKVHEVRERNRKPVAGQIFGRSASTTEKRKKVYQ